MPHSHALSKIIAVDGTPQVYTIDVAGVVKLFDIRSLKCIDSWRAFDPARVPTDVANDIRSSGSRDTFHLGDVGAACYTGTSHRSILFGAKHLYQFNTEVRSADAQRAHDMSEPLLAFAVGARFFVTATAATVRVWSVRRGTELSAFPMVRYSAAPLSAMCLDSAGARIFTGHGDGLICAISADTGVLLRQFAKHDTKILAIAHDARNGILVSSSASGELFFWEDSDHVNVGRRHGGQCRGLYGSMTRIPQRTVRRVERPPADVAPLLLCCVPQTLRHRILARWVFVRWRRFVARRSSGSTKLSFDQRTSFLVVPRPRGALYLRQPVTTLCMDEKLMRVAALSRKANLRVVDYSTAKPHATHRLFHGIDTELTTAALYSDRNLVFTADVDGAVFAWLVPPAANAQQDGVAMFVSKWLNKCQVMSYSHPMSEFLRANELDELDAQSKRTTIVEYEQETNDADVARATAAAKVAARHPKTPKSRDDKLSDIRPAVTSMHCDELRGYLVMGDDVGFVSIYEIDTLYRGVADETLALVHGQETGAPPRFVHSWRGHQHPVTHLGMMPHTMYAVISVATDNVVALWTPDGSWLSGLRQGPIVDRQWRLPNAERADAALRRLRYRKFLNAYKSKELVAVAALDLNQVVEVYSKHFLRKASEVLDVNAMQRAAARVATSQRVVNEMRTVQHQAAARERERPTLATLRRQRNVQLTLQLQKAAVQATGAMGELPDLPSVLDHRQPPERHTVRGQPLLHDSSTGHVDAAFDDDVARTAFDGITTAREQHDAALVKSKATSNVAIALRHAYTATDTVDPDVDTTECRVIADPLKHAQAALDKYRGQATKGSDRHSSALAAVRDIAKAQAAQAEKHLAVMSQVRAAGGTADAALVAGVVCLGGIGVSECNVRFPALRRDAEQRDATRPASRASSLPLRTTSRAGTRPAGSLAREAAREVAEARAEASTLCSVAGTSAPELAGGPPPVTDAMLWPGRSTSPPARSQPALVASSAALAADPMISRATLTTPPPTGERHGLPVARVVAGADPRQALADRRRAQTPLGTVLRGATPMATRRTHATGGLTPVVGRNRPQRGM